MTLAPSIYIGHGAPLNILWENAYHSNLQVFTQKTDIPKSIIVFSAHWEHNTPIQISGSEMPGVIYDFYGFPIEMYQLEYNCPGNPGLANKIAQTLEQNGVEAKVNKSQGLDHGAWIPLKIMYPLANIPVLQISIPMQRSPTDLFRLGTILQGFREENVMLMGSGNIIHNLGYTLQQMQIKGYTMNDFDEISVEPWANTIDEWFKSKLDDSDFSTLLNANTKLEHYDFIAPTTEHIDPLYFILGTMMEGEGVKYIHEGFEGGSISMRCFMSEC